MEHVPTHPPVAHQPMIEEEAPSGVAPVGERERIVAVDVLRGFAVLGLMAIHIFVFSQPVDPWSDPRGALTYEGANRLFIWIAHVLVFGKFMFLFALLFGAGVVFFDRKYRGGPLAEGAGLWYRRMGWLAGIGLLHGIFLFFGDILFLYALCGLAALWWVRRWSPRLLVLVGGISYVAGMALFLVTLLLVVSLIGDADEAELGMDAFSMQAQIEAYRGSYLDSLWMRLLYLLNNTMLIPFFTFWITSGIMLFGIALAKIGVLTGDRSMRFYGMLALIGIGIGLPASAMGFAWAEAGEFTPARSVTWAVLGLVLAVPQSLGYLGLVMLCVKGGVLRPLQAGLAAVGRMALSNYLLHSFLGALIFHGWGFGLYATLEFPALFGIVLLVWAINLGFSVLWLGAFRFGPVEWLWRSLTYFSMQPMLRREERETF